MRDDDRLDSWKDIAWHLRRTVRTVQRWERYCDLPVHRHVHGSGSSVYASRAEVDAWWKARSYTLADVRQLDLTAPEAHSAIGDAYDLYLLSNHYFNTRTVEGLTRSAAIAARALEQDPTYAIAAAALAMSYVTLASYTMEPPSRLMELGRAAARQAIALDDTLSTAHLALGFVAVGFDWDWDAGRAALDRAIALDPLSATAQQWSSLDYLVTGHPAAAIASCEEALRLDPSSAIIGAHTGWLLHLLGRDLEATELLESTRRRTPDFWRVHFNLAFVYISTGRLTDAVTAVDTAWRLHPYPALRAMMAAIYAAAGHGDAATRWLNELLAQPEHTSPYWVACAFATLGLKETALEWLWRSFEDREWYLILLGYEPLFGPLRGTDGFQKLLAGVRSNVSSDHGSHARIVPGSR